MSQQNSQPQMGAQTTGQQIGSQQLGNQQLGIQGTSGQASQGTGRQFRGRLPPQQRNALANVAEAVEVCGWCADQCIQEADPNMIECVRLCEDVVELGEAVLALAPRNSRQTDAIVQAFQQAVQACGQECGRHPHDHCQECARVLNQTAGAVQQLAGPGGQMAAQ